MSISTSLLIQRDYHSKFFGCNIRRYSKLNAYDQSFLFHNITYSLHKNSEIKHRQMYIFVSKTELVLMMF